MKKKLLSLLLALCLVMALVPMTAFAEENEQSNKISITTVDELLQFAKAVDNGEYDDKTDAVVSLDADLDLTGVAWKPIGSVFDGDGNLLHYFSGKFYGNGHTISNLNLSENYGKTEYPSFGFFSEVHGAEISGLTIQGNLDVSNSGYVYFGTVAGVAADSKISDCVSDVSFTDTDKYINGTVALCGYAINSTIEYCQNKGNFSITKDVSSFQMGGIVGLAENSIIQYCANTGDMTSWAPYTGGIVGQLYQASKIINCYSTGKMVPLGNGTTDFGGIAGTVGAEMEEKFHHVNAICQEIKAKYEYADADYMVMVPSGILDIITEGRALHHCAGSSDRYWDRIERRESFVMFLRKTADPFHAYYTLEVEPDGTVRQKRTEYDRQKKDIEQATEFLQKWQRVITARLTESDKALAAESRILREKEFIQLKKDRVIIHTGHLAGRLLADVLMADLMENTDSIQSPALAAAA